MILKKKSFDYKSFSADWVLVSGGFHRALMMSKDASHLDSYKERKWKYIFFSVEEGLISISLSYIEPFD